MQTQQPVERVGALLCRRIGFGRAISFGAIFVIHGTFSYVTSPSWLPSLFFPIYINRMHRTKHGSDSGVYDTEGRFVPE
jgi:peroxygenase